jgi:hypothetical protein
VREIIETVKRVTGKDFDVRISSPRAGEAVSIIADPARAKAEFGWHLSPVHAITTADFPTARPCARPIRGSICPACASFTTPSWQPALGRELDIARRFRISGTMTEPEIPSKNNLCT